MCGERLGVDGGERAVVGSSPRVRGTGTNPVPGSSRQRFIPACAGNGSLVGSVIARPTGSSPRVRGTGQPRRGPRPQARFIPACAGNGMEPARWQPQSPVHPRVCGERNPDLPADVQTTGSSPRVRGTGLGEEAASAVTRFIPACAGNGRTRSELTGTTTVHPRVCGERSTIEARRPPTTGSSPRVRGTERRGRRSVLLRRFIPACAGNGHEDRRRAGRLPVHPRVCGERMSSGALFFPNSGSSPRVRGTDGGSLAGLVDLRFIPACAGNGRGSLRRAPGGAVHPRVCGERRGGGGGGG